MGRNGSAFGGRSSTRPRGRVARQAPSRQAPLALLLRQDLPLFLADRVQLASGEEAADIGGLSEPAREVMDYLARRGASFLSDVARGTGRLPTQVEEALWELVARGLVTGDGIAGLRMLLQPESKRQSTDRHLRFMRSANTAPRALPVGRWSLWGDGGGELPSEAERNEHYARQLLRRYGVVFRDLLGRDRQAPPWRVLLGIYRRLEARGEIRGGRFVAGFAGEQFALPEAVDALRTVRRQPPSDEIVMVHTGGFPPTPPRSSPSATASPSRSARSARSRAASSSPAASPLEQPSGLSLTVRRG
jgi:ATP-dependent Lhr-like helicase